ncbi:MAG: 2-phosphosulfolactate phosphatase [Anaerolineae bacterium]|nr:2-phosphosulfolactate phosphatase [Anaerolineae bacterium]
MYFDQNEYHIRFEWGLSGLETLLPVSDVMVIVDVLSFTTCVDIVVGRGGLVLPYRGEAEALSTFAQSHHALIASHKRQSNETGYSLSPASLLTIPAGTRLVLPSPNGSTLSLDTGDVPTLAGCLRNATAVAAKAATLGQRISIIAAGERWPDGLLRPSLEDLLGAGAIIAQLPGTRSPEADMAVAAFHHAQRNLPDILARCGSGKELIGRGFADDVQLASQLNVSHTAPLLTEGVYQQPGSTGFRGK